MNGEMHAVRQDELGGPEVLELVCIYSSDTCLGCRLLGSQSRAAPALVVL